MDAAVLMRVLLPGQPIAWLVRWMHGAPQAQVYPIHSLENYQGPRKWKFAHGVCVIHEIRGDALEAARVLMGRDE